MKRNERKWTVLGLMFVAALGCLAATRADLQNQIDLEEQLKRPILPKTARMLCEGATTNRLFQPAATPTCRTVSCETVKMLSYGDIKIVRETFAAGGGVLLPAVTFEPMHVTGSPVIILGNSTRGQRERYVRWALAVWRPAMALDLFGTGEIASSLGETKGETVFSTRLAAKGYSLDEIRADELIAAADKMKRQYGFGVQVFAGSQTFKAAQRAQAKRPDLICAVDAATPAVTPVPFGAEPDWRKTQRELQGRIDALAAQGGGTLKLTRGLYYTGALDFRPGVNLHLDKGAVILGANVAEAYPKRETRVEGRWGVYFPGLINAERCDGFTITGEGIIDGQGMSLWRAFWPLYRKEPRHPQVNVREGLMRPRVLWVADSKNVDISGVTFKNGKFWTTHYYRCTNLKIHDCAMLADSIGNLRGPSTDAIDLDGCKDVVVSNVVMNVNDDAVVMKGGRGIDANDLVKNPHNASTENVLVTDCLFGPQCHACLTLGSDCFLGRNAVLRNSRVEGAAILLHLKMRIDTPQLYENILVENCSGWAGAYLSALAWSQMTDLGGRPEPPASVARHVTMRNNHIRYKVFTRYAKEKFVSYEDFDIREPKKP